jgi:membrane protease YdiL (CAAX protease family)
MTTFQTIAFILVVIWLLVVLLRFRRSSFVLIVGLTIIGLYTLVSFLAGMVTPNELGLGAPRSWLSTLGYSLAGLAVILAHSPVADWLASRWFKQPPRLEAFRGIQQSGANLLLGIVAAWLFGGVLEELIARGIVLNAIAAGLNSLIGGSVAVAVAVCIAALGAGAMHSYQGPRAMVIITQLSILFGILFVISGYNLWAVMICHGLFDTVAFIRFATRRSRYSKLDGGQVS